MRVFEFSCVACGPFCVIPIEDMPVRRKGGDLPPRRCSRCGGPISIDVVYDYEPSAAASLVPSQFA